MDDGLEDLDFENGRRISRDEQGRIRKVHLPSDVAAEMGRTGAERRHNHLADVEKMLKEAGYSDENPAPTYVLAMARQAQKSTSALRDWMRFNRVAMPSSDDVATPRPGEVCPTCKHMFVQFSNAGAHEFNELARQVMAMFGEAAQDKGKTEESATASDGGSMHSIV